MLTVDIAYDVTSRLLRITNISTGVDNVLIGTTGDDLSTMIRCTFDGDVSEYDTIWAEFDVRVPKNSKKNEYLHPAVQFSAENTLLIPAHVLSNTIRNDLPMQIALENSETGIRTVSINKLHFKIADAVDADHTPYNVVVPRPEIIEGNMFTAVIGDGVNTTYNVIHNLSTPLINLFCYANTDFKPDIQVAWERITDDEVSVTFSEPPEVDSYTVCIYAPGSSDVLSVNGHGGHVTQEEMGLVTEWQDTPDDIHFPSEKLTKDTIDDASSILDAKIDQEIQDRIDDVDAEESRATTAEGALDGKIDQEIIDRAADVDAEEDRAKAAEQAIDESVVHKAGAETIPGSKTFTSKILGTNGATITGDVVIGDTTDAVNDSLTVNGPFASPKITDNGSNVVVSSNLSISGTISQTDATKTATLQDTTLKSLNVTGATSLSTVSSSSKATLNSLEVTTTSDLKGVVTAESTLDVTGKITGNGQLQIDGTSQFNDNVTVATGKKIIVPTVDTATITNSDVNNGVQVNDTLEVTGATSVSTLSASGNIEQTGGTTTLKGTTVDSLTSVGNATVGGTLGVTGQSTLGVVDAGATTLDSVHVEGISTLDGAVTVGTQQTSANLTVTGNETVGGTLGVTGKVTAGGSLDVTGETETDTLKVTTLTSGMVLVSSGTGQVVESSDISSTELSYLDNVTSNIQQQINGKAPTDHASTATTYGVGDSTHYGHVMFDEQVNTSRVSNSDKIAISESGIISYVNNSVNNVAAYYITDSNGLPWATKAALMAAQASDMYSGGQQRTPTRNDYTIVSSDESHEQYDLYDGFVNFDSTSDYIGHYIKNSGTPATYTLVTSSNKDSLSIVAGTTEAYERIVPSTRYIYNSDSATYSSSNWNFQYTFNQQYTQAQMSALNSGITAAKVDKLDTVERGAEVNVNADWNSVSGDSQILNRPNVRTSLTGWDSTPSDTALVSEKLTKDTLDTKVDKTTHPGQGIYLYGNTDSQVQVPCQTEPNQYTVAYRASGGVIRVGTPTSDDHAATKKYVDDEDALKLDKSTIQSDTASSLTATAMGSTANRQYAVGYDANGDLSVNIPWVDTAVFQEAVSTNVERPLMLGYRIGTNPISDSVNGPLFKTTSITANPSTGTITATAFAGTSTYATGIGSASTDIGDATTPVYVEDGVVTALGYTIEKSVPSNAEFTDKFVMQSSVTSNENRPILLSYFTTSNGTTPVTNVIYRNNSIYANPSTGIITATGFAGNLTGNVTGNVSGTAGSVAYSNITSNPITVSNSITIANWEAEQ